MALQKVGDPTKHEEIAKAMGQLKFDSAAGPIEFDQTTHLAMQDDNHIPVTFFQIWDGKRYLIAPTKYGRGEFRLRPGSNSRNAASDSGKTETHEVRRAPSRARRSAFAFERSRIADNLTKSFGGLRAVDDVSFSLEANEILGIAGPNGSGKSTLFNILTNIPFPADSGRIVLDGREIQDVAPGGSTRLHARQAADR